MNVYYIAILILNSLSLGIELAHHSEKKIIEYNFWTKLLAVVIEMFLITMAIKKGF